MNNEMKSREFLEAIINGADLLTGEILEDSSVWKHPIDGCFYYELTNHDLTIHRC